MSHRSNDNFLDPPFSQDQLNNLFDAIGFEQEAIEQQQIMDSIKARNTKTTRSLCDHPSDEKQIDLPPKRQRNELLEHLHQLADEHIEPLLVSHCSVKVNASFDLTFGQAATETSGTNNPSKTVKCILDTGAEVNVMTQDIAKELGLQDYIDPDYVGDIRGVGSGKIVGYIPYIVFNIGSIELKSNFLILDNSAPNIDESKTNHPIPSASPEVTFSRPDQPLLKDSDKNEKGGIKCILLSMPFMMFYGMELNFKRSKLIISGHEVDMIIEDH